MELLKILIFLISKFTVMMLMIWIKLRRKRVIQVSLKKRKIYKFFFGSQHAPDTFIVEVLLQVPKYVHSHTLPLLERTHSSGNNRKRCSSLPQHLFPARETYLHQSYDSDVSEIFRVLSKATEVREVHRCRFEIPEVVVSKGMQQLSRVDRAYFFSVFAVILNIGLLCFQVVVVELCVQ